MSGVAVASLALPSAAGATGAAATTHDRSGAAAGFLAGRLAGKHHNHYIGSYDSGGGNIVKYADYGETADAVLSLDASGTAQAAARRATSYLEHHAGSYALSDTAPNYYPGSIAKLLLVAEAQHTDPASFGGIDLIGALVGDEGAGGTTGEYQNPGDTTFPSVLVQSLAVLALADAPGQPAQPSADAVDFLAGQQCSDGGLQVDVRDDPSSDCTAASEDIDTTAYAVQALVAAGDAETARTALRWLSAQQHQNGGWGETPSAKSDANSTAIAVEAMVAAKQRHKAASAWLAGQQLGCSAKAAQRGAVVLQGHAFDKATALRATSQAGVALAGKSISEVDRTGAKPGVAVLRCAAKHHHHHHGR